MIKISQAVDADLDVLLKLGKDMQLESPRFRNSDYDEKKVMTLFKNLIAEDRGFLIVAKFEQQIIGFMMAVVIEEFFGSSLYASDLVVYVAPDRRDGRAVIKLVKEYETWAKSKGARHIMLGISTGIHPEATKTFYNRLGFKDAGYLTLMEN